MDQAKNFSFEEYNKISGDYRPFRHSFNLKQFTNKIDLTDGKFLKNGLANYVRYDEFDKEMYLLPEKINSYTYNSIFKDIYKSGVMFTSLDINDFSPIDKHNPNFGVYVSKYISNLIEWTNNVFLPDLLKISKLLNTNSIYIKYCPGMVRSFDYSSDICEAYSLETYYFRFCSYNKYINHSIYSYDFIQHLNYLFLKSNNLLFNTNLEFYVYKPKYPKLESNKEYVLNIKII